MIRYIIMTDTYMCIGAGNDTMVIRHEKVIGVHGGRHGMKCTRAQEHNVVAGLSLFIKEKIETKISPLAISLTISPLSPHPLTLTFFNPITSLLHLPT